MTHTRRLDPRHELASLSRATAPTPPEDPANFLDEDEYHTSPARDPTEHQHRHPVDHTVGTSDRRCLHVAAENPAPCRSGANLAAADVQTTSHVLRQVPSRPASLRLTPPIPPGDRPATGCVRTVDPTPSQSSVEEQTDPQRNEGANRAHPGATPAPTHTETLRHPTPDGDSGRTRQHPPETRTGHGSPRPHTSTSPTGSAGSTRNTDAASPEPDAAPRRCARSGSFGLAPGNDRS